MLKKLFMTFELYFVLFSAKIQIIKPYDITWNILRVQKL